MAGTLNKGSLVKGTGGSGGGGSSTATINYFTDVTGTILDTQLTLGNAVMVFKNGVLLEPTNDYTIASGVITFVTALESTDKIAVINGNLDTIDLTPYALKTDLNNYKEKAETITIDTASITISEIKANANYVFSNNAITDITLTACETSFEETSIEFSTGGSAPTLTDNSGITWVDGSAPTLNASKSYIIVIFNKIGFVKEY